MSSNGRALHERHASDYLVWKPRLAPYGEPTIAGTDPSAEVLCETPSFIFSCCLRLTLAPIDRDRIILAKVGWSERYDSLDGVDNPRGRFAGLRGGPGNESFNFKRAPDGRYYGYFRANKGRLRLKRISTLATGPALGGVTVVWVSVPPGGKGLRVVGWYRNATIFDSERKEDGPWRRADYGVESGDAVRFLYICNAPADESARLIVTERERWMLPESVTKIMRRTNVLHPHVEHSTERARWVSEMNGLIARIENFRTESVP